tara:strand:+ start:879 stop:1385 length:507 start_codon:yes stop_codon:yes gene_type:complete
MIRFGAISVVECAQRARGAVVAAVAAVALGTAVTMRSVAAAEDAAGAEDASALEGVSERRVAGAACASSDLRARFSGGAEGRAGAISIGDGAVPWTSLELESKTLISAPLDVTVSFPVKFVNVRTTSEPEEERRETEYLPASSSCDADGASSSHDMWTLCAWRGGESA